MAVLQISRIQHRRGFRIDLPNSLNDAEFGWAEDAKELFIGNGPFHDGNTQILTDSSPAALPPYTYISNTDSIAKTGVDPFGDPSFPDANFDTVRSYQEKFDDVVSVKDYGAVGDFDFSNPGGPSDDTGAILRAMQDIYDETNGDDPRRRRAIYFPAGVYRVSQSVPLYPFSRIVGDGKGCTVIFLDRNLGLDPNITFLTGNDCVARTVDSLGASGLNLGISGALESPQHVQVFGMTFRSNVDSFEAGGPVPTNGSVKEVIKLDQAKNVRFENVEIRGNWNFTDTAVDGSIGILISRIGDGAIDMKNYSFKGCEFRNTAFGFNVLDSIENVLVHDSTFDTHHDAIKLGFDGTLDLNSGTGGVPRLFRASSCSFDNIERIGFHVKDPAVIDTTSAGNLSTYNHYKTVSVLPDLPGPFPVPSVFFDEFTRGCASIGDTFNETLSLIACSSKLTNKRVQNHSDIVGLGNQNIVMNAQDRFHLPHGFCGTIVIDGDLTVLGNISLTGSIINLAASTIPNPITTIPWADGNAIFFEYAWNLLTEPVQRVGVMRIIHDESVIDFTDTYNELGGPPSQLVTLDAIFNGTNLEINLVTALTLTNFRVHFNTRVLNPN